ncbi:MAG TPA: acetyl-CoA carboxylase biotin carboxylase subunit [Candidatus Limnocylindrales bacterium]|nr:acetyl-CoA carboxylase biotin carboxylase subunit [Candidatus Limnocylindrales bacterium]
MFTKILIANRGEIALRVLRACRTLGIGAVVAYSEADRESLAAQLADEAICIGPADAKHSYLSAPAIISAAVVTGCDAIHPGYGFLSEDEGFADVVRAHDLTFIGPPAEVLERFASKEATRRLLGSHGLPTIPGSGMLRDEAHALGEAERVGYPVLIKPSAGGGGKGMRLVRTPRELESAFKVSRSEAKAAFGNDALYLEKYLDDNRHVEIQVAVDRFGNAVHMGDRDCSVQRRHQKVIEETPSPALSNSARKELADRAVRAIAAAGYENLGTLEFLIDAKGDAYFIEINCRVQVEHPITELCTGIDLVALQIKIAAGEPLGLTQADIVSTGHAIEFRILAEDPGKDFKPQGGQIGAYLAPGGPGVRMDSHIYPGYEIPPYYDSLLGKLSVWAPDRAQAIARADAALREMLVDGVMTNIELHRAILANQVFIDGKVTTSLLDRVGSAPFVAAGNR